MKLAIAQIAPVFLHRDATVDKVARWIDRAGDAGADLVAFGETLIPGYPLWLCRTDAARFNAPDQKAMHALYVDQAVDVHAHLRPLSEAARRNDLAVIVGVAERATDRGSSIFCSRVFIGRAGEVLSVHRKLMPTYEERLAWGIGDGAGLVTHDVAGFRVGALNCWENWMPLARAALYSAGEDLHVMLWPGSRGLTRDLTRFVALESRGYVASAGAIVRDIDIPLDIPQRDRFCHAGEIIYDGGSCVAGPDGSWIVEPVVGREELTVVQLELKRVREERQNFDPAGHYARPDVLRLGVNRRVRRTADFVEDR